jgi:VWFA-related protein
VTDKKGQIVTDLTADDFEVREDGRPQKISNLSFIATASTQPARPSAPADKNATAPLPPVRIQPEQVRRTIALVVDDLCLSWTSINYVRKAVKKFVDEQMQPGDLVAIIRTAGSIGVLQQFTSDKRQLYAATERLKWYPNGCGGIEPFAPLGEAFQPPRLGTSPDDQNDKIDSDKDTSGINDRNPTSDLSDFREGSLTAGTLGALSYIVRGLKDLPGRKTVLFISDGFPLIDRNDKIDPKNKRIMDAVDLVADLASRSSVVVYTLDAHGLAATGFTAADQISGSGIIAGGTEFVTGRNRQLNDMQDGLTYLARQTGGFPVLKVATANSMTCRMD